MFYKIWLMLNERKISIIMETSKKDITLEIKISVDEFNNFINETNYIYTKLGPNRIETILQFKDALVTAAKQ